MIGLARWVYQRVGLSLSSETRRTPQTVRSLMELVPFLDKWTDSGSKLDLKAIYRRPGAGITLTSPLPLKRHSDWSAKGFTFVSLATLADLGSVQQELRAYGHDPIAMKSGYTKDGVFDVAQYLKGAQADDAAYLADLQAKVDKYGTETVTDMMRLQDPAFTIPAGIVTPEPKETIGSFEPKAKK